jgi:hypothetical protein
MDIAFCTIDNKTYDIASFSNLNEQQLSNLRRALVCQQCQAPGYYRKEARDGKSACFGAYHKENCKLKIQGSTSQIILEIVEEVNVISTNNQVIDIAFGAYELSRNSSTNNPISNIKSTSTTTSQQHTKKPIQQRNSQRGLKSLLRMLTHTDSFASSDIEINTGTQPPIKAKNLFVHFDEISKKHVTEWFGYWGIISHANPKITWLNIANQQTVSILIRDSLKNHLLKRYKIDIAEELAGALILVFGELKIAKSGKWYIEIDNDNPEHIFIKIAK